METHTPTAHFISEVLPLPYKIKLSKWLQLPKFHLQSKLSLFKIYLFTYLFKIFNVVFLLLGDSPASEFYIPMFQNTLSVPSS